VAPINGGGERVQDYQVDGNEEDAMMMNQEEMRNELTKWYAWRGGSATMAPPAMSAWLARAELALDEQAGLHQKAEDLADMLSKESSLLVAERASREALRLKFIQARDKHEGLVKAHSDVCAMLDKANREKDALAETLADIREAHRTIMEEKCAGDEVHCTCVPVLRAELATLRGAVGEALARKDCDGYFRITSDTRQVLEDALRPHVPAQPAMMTEAVLPCNCLTGHDPDCQAHHPQRARVCVTCAWLKATVMEPNCACNIQCLNYSMWTPKKPAQDGTKAGAKWQKPRGGV
jgi:hypothetical protein